jgi:hypothetical protein
MAHGAIPTTPIHVGHFLLVLLLLASAEHCGGKKGSCQNLLI